MTLKEKRLMNIKNQIAQNIKKPSPSKKKKKKCKKFYKIPIEKINMEFAVHSMFN